MWSPFVDGISKNCGRAPAGGWRGASGLPISSTKRHPVYRNAGPRGRDGRVASVVSMVTSPGKEAVELVGEKVPVALSERRGAAEKRAGRAKVVHQVAYGEALADIVLGIQLPSRVEGMPSTSDDLGGEGNIGGDH